MKDFLFGDLKKKKPLKAAVAALGQLLSSLGSCLTDDGVPALQENLLNCFSSVNTGKLHFSDYSLCTAPHGHSKDSCRMHRA